MSRGKKVAERIGCQAIEMLKRTTPVLVDRTPVSIVRVRFLSHGSRFLEHQSVGRQHD
jgi:hypothetical protein